MILDKSYEMLLDKGMKKDIPKLKKNNEYER